MTKVRMVKSGKVKSMPFGAAKELVLSGDAEWYKEEEPVNVPYEKRPLKSETPSYNTRQMRPKNKIFRNKVI